MLTSTKPIPIQKKIAKGSVRIMDLGSEKKLSKEPKAKHSLWWVTITPNVPFPDPNDPRLLPFCQALQRVVQNIVLDDEELKNVLKINTRVKNKTIDSSDSEIIIERGSIKKFPHCHGTISIRHFSNIHLGYDKFPKQVLVDLKRECRSLGLPIPKNVRFFAEPLVHLAKELDNKERIRAYMMKNMHEMSERADLESTTVGERDNDEIAQDYVPYKQHGSSNGLQIEELDTNELPEDGNNMDYELGSMADDSFDDEAIDELPEQDLFEMDLPKPGSGVFHETLPPEEEEVKPGEVKFVKLSLPNLVDVRQKQSQKFVTTDL